jgi:hypothetical protein
MRLAAFAALASIVVAGCSGKKTYHTTVELTRVHPFGRDPKAPGMMDIELRYSECPGDARKLIRGDKEFAKCAVGFKTGAKVPVDVVSTYVSDRGAYRSEIVKIGDCTIKTDPKDEANYEQIEECTDLKMSGGVVGVHCDRTRNAALVAKCPWLRR